MKHTRYQPKYIRADMPGTRLSTKNTSYSNLLRDIHMYLQPPIGVIDADSVSQLHCNTHQSPIQRSYYLASSRQSTSGGTGYNVHLAQGFPKCFLWHLRVAIFNWCTVMCGCTMDGPQVYHGHLGEGPLLVGSLRMWAPCQQTVLWPF